MYHDKGVLPIRLLIPKKNRWTFYIDKVENDDVCLLWNSSINVVTDSKVLNISIKNKRNWWKSKQKFIQIVDDYSLLLYKNSKFFHLHVEILLTLSDVSHVIDIQLKKPRVRAISLCGNGKSWDIYSAFHTVRILNERD